MKKKLVLEMTQAEASALLSFALIGELEAADMPDVFPSPTRAAGNRAVERLRVLYWASNPKKKSQ